MIGLVITANVFFFATNGTNEHEFQIGIADLFVQICVISG